MIASGNVAPVLVSVVVSITVVTSVPTDGFESFKLQLVAELSSSRLIVASTKSDVVTAVEARKSNGILFPVVDAVKLVHPVPGVILVLLHHRQLCLMLL